MTIIVWSIVKNLKNFFWYTTFSITYAVCSFSIFIYIMTMTSIFTILSIFSIFIFKLFVTAVAYICIFIWFLLSFCFKHHFLKFNYFLYLNDDIINIEKPDGICFLAFMGTNFSGLFLHPSIVLSKIQDMHK